MTVMKTGLFRLHLDGDCMEPAYAHGSVVEFQVVRDDPAVLPPGDYVLCRVDCTATFKRLISADAEKIVLFAVNQKKYPGSFEVPTQEVVRVAKVIHTLEPPPEVVIPKNLKRVK